MKRLPAVAFFRGAKFLGASEGLKNWDEYLEELGVIGSRTDAEAPRRTITIVSSNQEENYH